MQIQHTSEIGKIHHQRKKINVYISVKWVQITKKQKTKKTFCECLTQLCNVIKVTAGNMFFGCKMKFHVVEIQQ